MTSISVPTEKSEALNTLINSVVNFSNIVDENNAKSVAAFYDLIESLLKNPTYNEIWNMFPEKYTKLRESCSKMKGDDALQVIVKELMKDAAIYYIEKLFNVK